MNPFRRKRIIGNALTIVTFALVIANLLPIGWMVWCSLKDNNEIMSGQVGLGRRRSEVNFIAPRGDGWIVGSSDGGIARFGVGGEGLVTAQAENRGWFTSSWAQDGDALWSFSADKGLQKLDTGFDVQERVSFGDLKDAWSAQFPRNPWRTVWVNDVLGTSLVATPKKIFAAMRMEKSPGLIEFDKASARVRFHTLASGLPFAVDQVLEMPGRQGPMVLLVGADGLIGWNGESGSVRFSHRWGEAGLPWERPALVQGIAEEEIAMVQGQSVEIWSVREGKKSRTIGLADGLDRGQILSLTEGGGRLWFGCAQGLVGTDRRAGTLADSAADSSGSEELMAVAILDRDAVGAELVHVGAQASGEMLVGGGNGEVSRVRDGKGILQAKGQASLPQAQIYVHWRNYVDLWRNLPFGTYLKNSLLVCTSVMVISMILASLAGYALARFEFGGKELFGYSILATQMIPGVMFLIPLYILFTQVGEKTGVSIIGTRWGLVLLYSAFYVPFTIWILRGFFAAIPRELEEAALVDGCTPFRAFWSVILPAAMPGIVASGIYVFLTVWDELMFAWMLTNAETSTIPVGIRLFAGNYQNRYDLMMAAATVATLPVMVLFFLMQRHIVSGLTAGAVKG